MFFKKSFLLISLFVLISSFGLPLIVDLLIFFFIFLLSKSDNIVLTNINLLFLVFIIFGNFFLIKSIDENKLFYRGHEKFFLPKEDKYKKNVNYKMMMPHGDIPALDVCSKNEIIFEPREQLFVTDENGFRNNQSIIDQADIILVGDSFIAGSSNSQENIPANVLANLIKKNVYSITVIAGPKEYENHIKDNINKFKKEAKLYLFYFSGNDFTIENVIKTNINNKTINNLKYKIRFAYERVERNKDRLFIDHLSKFYNQNFFYKKIRPQSQRFFKKLLIKWTEACPVEYKLLKNNTLGFYYLNDYYLDVKTYIFTDIQILKKIDKIFFIPTKLEVYDNFFKNINNNKQDKNKKFEFLKKEYSKLGKDVLDLTETLINEASSKIKNDKYIFWKDDTHWNTDGIEAAMKFVAKNIK